VSQTDDRKGSADQKELVRRPEARLCEVFSNDED
jgi:hypothetical protein